MLIFLFLFIFELDILKECYCPVCDIDNVVIRSPYGDFLVMYRLWVLQLLIRRSMYNEA